MYTVSKGPSKFVAKTRRGITPSLERLDSYNRETKKSPTHKEPDAISPKPYFQPVNGKKSNSFRSQQEAISPQHEELIKFIYDSWISICPENEEETSEKTLSSSKVVYFEDKEPSGELKDFIPFDLESWWGKRLFNTITKSIP